MAALRAGANAVGCMKVKDITFDTSFRSLCEMNSCGHYGRGYTCPPDCGEIEELMARAKSYENAFIYQSVHPLEDSFDADGMQEASKKHNALVGRLAEETRDKLKGALYLGAGACGICGVCAKTEAADGAEPLPCRHPDRAIVSMEAYGMAVSQLADKCGLNYINGENTVTYFGAVLY